MSLSGFWKLNHDKSSSQRALLTAMGRKSWQISVIDQASEEFCCWHFRKPVADQKSLHFFEKNVTIFLSSTILKLISLVTRVEFDRVRYSHKLTANGKEKAHPDDEKRFGPCTSRTSWETGVGNREGLMIRWYLSNGLLKVFHFVNGKGELEAHLEFTDHKGHSVSAIKVYDRHPFTEEQTRTLRALPYASDFFSP